MMDKAALDRLRSLAGTASAPEKVEDQSRRNMYQIRDTLMEASELDEEPNEGKTESVAGSKHKERAARIAELRKEYNRITGKNAPKGLELRDYKEMVAKAKAEGKTESEQMREWANSVYKQYEDRGHYQEPPEGETVDLSLRRYLNADPQKVKIEENHTEDGMLKEYEEFLEDEEDENGLLNELTPRQKAMKQGAITKTARGKTTQDQKPTSRNLAKWSDPEYTDDWHQAHDLDFDELTNRSSGVKRAKSMMKHGPRGTKAAYDAGVERGIKTRARDAAARGDKYGVSYADSEKRTNRWRKADAVARNRGEPHWNSHPEADKRTNRNVMKGPVGKLPK